MKKYFNFKNISILLGLILFMIILKCLNHTSLAIRYILLYMIIMLGSISLSYIFKKKTAQTISLYFLISFVFLYIFAICNILLIGLYLYIFLNIALDIIVVFKIIKNKDKNIKKLIINNASIIYTILFIVFAIGTRNTSFAVWDEFTFWSIATKNMYYSNSLYINSATTLVNGGYPPCPTLIQYFFCKIIGNYSQGIELFAYQMFGFSLFMTFFKSDKINDKISTICVLLTILFIPAIFCGGYFYFTIYADSILGILVGYLLYEFFTSKKDNFTYIVVALSLFTIALTKSMGLVMSLIIFLAIVLYYLLSKKITLKTIKNGEFKKIIIYFLSIVLAFLSWRVYVKISNVNYNAGYFIPMKTNSILDMFKVIYYTFVGTNVEINSTFQTFFSDFFDKAIYSDKPFGMTASCWISIFIIVYLLVYKFVIKEKDKKKYKKCFCLIAFCTILYILLLQVAYYIEFSEKEAIFHNSMFRYVGTIFISILMFIVGVFFNESDKKLYILVPVLLLPFTPISLISNATITSGINNYNNSKNVQVVRDFSEYINSRVDDNARIFPIHQTQSKDSLLLQFRYFMTPKFILMVEPFSEKEEHIYAKFNSMKELEKELNDNYDYVVVLNSDEYFKENYSDLFENSEILDWSLYKIIKTNDKVLLKKVD